MPNPWDNDPIVTGGGANFIPPDPRRIAQQNAEEEQKRAAEARANQDQARQNASAGRDTVQTGITQRGEQRDISKQGFDFARNLRTEYQSLPQVKEYQTVRAMANEHEAQTVANVSKLARTFTMQMEELRLLRGRSRTTRQNIKVSKETHQHVHYHHDRGAGENGGQPHAPNGDATCRSSALSCHDESGKVVSLPRRARKAGV